MRTSMRISFLALLAAALAFPAMAQQDVMSTVIGGGPSNMPAIDANISNPTAAVLDSAGNSYISSPNQNRVFKVDTTGLLTVLAGNGLPGYSGDGVSGAAANAELNQPWGLAVDTAGNVYIADQYNQVIRKVDSTNTISTFSGTQATCGGTANTYCYPQGLATDASGNMYIADSNDCEIKKIVLSSNTVSVVAGNGTCGYSGDGKAATTAALNSPSSVAIDSAGDLFISDGGNCVIREVVNSSGLIKTIAGGTNNTALGCGYNGDNIAATTANIYYPYGIQVNSAGTTVTIADTYNWRIRQFSVGGKINTIAGNDSGAGFCGDGGLATSACLTYPYGITLSASGSYYASDSDNSRVRAFTLGGNINTVAGNGSATVATVTNGVPPTDVTLYNPWGVFEDPSGNAYVADTTDEVVRELVQSSSVVNTLAGNGTTGFSGDGAAAASAQLSNPAGVARDSAGNIYIADQYNCAIRMVNTAGTITTFAGIDNGSGSASCGYSGDGGPATSAQLYYPASVYVDNKNNVYIPDTSNAVVRVVTNGTINTIAGIPGDPGYSGDGGPAANAQLNAPSAVAEDGAGNLYVADTNNHRIREINASTGMITTVAGNGAPTFSGDGIATENSLNTPAGVWADANGNLFIADQYNQRLRWVNAAGIMTTFAGTSTAGYNGDGNVATSAELYYPTGIWEDPSGNFLVADQYNYRIRGIGAFAALNSSAGNLSFPLLSVGSTSPAQLATISSVGPLSISNISVTGDFSESDDCPSNLPNATTCTMYVYFTPKAAGTRNGNITFNTNGYFNPVSTINLTGIGSAIALTGAPANFGNVHVKATSAVKTVTVKNNGTTTITMGAITLNETTDYAISSNTCPVAGATLAAKASCAIGLTLTPQSTGTKKGAVIINDNDPTSPQIVGLIGTGTSNVSLTPTAINFAATTAGTTSAVSKITLANKTGTSLTLGSSALSLTGPFAIATGTTCTNGLVIAINGTCIINVQFKPTVVGYVSGTLTIADSDVTSPQTVALSGTGTSVKFTPVAVNFGTVAKGTQAQSSTTVTNVGTTTITVSGLELNGTNSADFQYSNGCGAPLTAGQSCTIYLYFTPSITGAEKATLKVFDNSQGSPQSVGLSGTGK